MGVIQVKFDHGLQQSDIIIPLTSSSKDEAKESYTRNQSDIQQTHIYGIQSPLISVNSIVIDFIDVLDFELKCTDVTPSVSMIVRDRYKLSTMLDTPSIDNELRVQILPKFEDKYKKINLTFYITTMRYSGDLITLKGEYKMPKFVSSNLKSFGECNTYKLFEAIAIDTQLGFASNCDENDGDKRYIYCDYKPYQDLLHNEIKRSGTDLQILDYWIDWWNNLVLVDIYERYNAVDTDQDMQIWVAGQNKEVGEGMEITPIQVIATLNNHPTTKSSELFVQNYHISNKPGQQMYSGTDHLYSTYEGSRSEYMDYLVQDGDTQKDIFEKYEYLGEVYGEYNYLLAGKKRESFLQKMSSNETVDVILQTPLLGVMRGNRVNFMWYINDSGVDSVHSGLENAGAAIPSENVETNIPIENIENTTPDGGFEIDKTISGQYLILGCKMRFINMKWEYILTLGRPTIMKPKITNDNNE